MSTYVYQDRKCARCGYGEASHGELGRCPEALYGFCTFIPMSPAHKKKFVKRSPACTYCGKTGHNIRGCTVRLNEALSPTSQTQINLPKQRKPHTCSKCGEVGHNSRACGRPRSQKSETTLTPREHFVLRTEARYPGIELSLRAQRDADVARMYGISRERARQLRVAFEISPHENHLQRDLTEEELALLGTETDTEIAEKLGITPGRVSLLRRARGIPPFVRYDLIAHRIETEAKHLVGIISDGKLEKQLGLPPRSVWSYRRKYNVPTKVLSPRHKDFVPRDKDQIRKLVIEGTTDEELAALFGSTPGSMRAIRLSLGLRKSEARPRITKEQRTLLIDKVREVGSVSKAARELGMPESTARAVIRRSKKNGNT